MKILALSGFLGIYIANAAPSLGLDWGELIKAGGIAAICAFVLVRLEPRLRGVERSIDRLSRAILLLISELPHCIDAVKTQCKAGLSELDTAAQSRGDAKHDE